MNTMGALVFVLAAAAIAPSAQDLLSTAKDQYAAASYEEAVATLARVAEATPDVERLVQQYRVFCLFALGRRAEAESSAERLIRSQPLADLDEASPQIEAMFRTVRKRLLPGLIRAEYRSAKSAIDQKNFSESEPHLISARKLLASAQEAGVWDEALADLGLLVDGFMELGRGAARTTPAEAPSQPVAPVAASGEGDSRPHAEVPATPAIYTIGDEGVIPPVAIDQRLPSVPKQLLTVLRAAAPTGLLDILIDQTGAVQAAVIRRPISQAYDGLLLSASRRWRYRPATKDGAPVTFRKLILVSVSGQ